MPKRSDGDSPVMERSWVNPTAQPSQPPIRSTVVHSQPSIPMGKLGMNDSVRETLKTLVAQYGTELCSNRQRVEGLLRDYCGQYRREINVLVTAVRVGVAEELLHPTAPLNFLVPRLAKRLYEEAGIAPEFAAWAVDVWREVLS